jgi:hypothetical protein
MPMTTTSAYERALEHTGTGLALVTGSTANDARVRHALQTTRGRILMNLNRPEEAAAAVAGVPTEFRYEIHHSQTTQSNAYWTFNNNARRYSISANEGTNGLDFATASDPRVPVCVGGDAACTAIGVTEAVRDDLTQPLYVQMLWPSRESTVTIISGIEARMIEAEAQLRAADPAGALATLNAARATVAGLDDLIDAGTEDARIDQLFRERGFWFFGRGHRLGDMRRLIRQYDRTADAVFPTGAWHKGGNYGSDVTVPVPLAESNNPNLENQVCMDRNA